MAQRSRTKSAEKRPVPRNPRARRAAAQGDGSPKGEHARKSAPPGGPEPPATRRERARPRRKPPPWWWSRAHRLLLSGAGLTLAVIGLILMVAAMLERWDRASRLATQPPPLAPLDRLLEASIWRAGQPISLQAQLDRPRAYFLPLGRRAADAFTAPLYAPDETDVSAPVEALLLEPEGAPPDAVFVNWVVGVGPRATVVELSGRVMEPGAEFRALAAQTFAAEGLTLAPDALFIDPFDAIIEPAPALRMLPLGLAAAVSLIGVALIVAARRPRGLRRSDASPRKSMKNSPASTRPPKSRA